MDNENRIIITVLGKDKVGIIAGVTAVLAEANANILDISQTVLQEFLTMILVVDLSECKIEFDELCERLNEAGKKIGVQINAQHESVFKYMHRI
ncbi:MAG: ACT domain-containing protein [Thermoanaerobacteraceae bacterium]|nr:ACT domain-containing protein [Thermoanaerobacteraceae bacterium]